MELTGQNFAETIEIIDGNRYVDCAFDRCTIIYRGGFVPTITGCRFDDCKWQFEDAAERTLVFMRHLYHGAGDNGRILIEQTLESLREPLDPWNRPVT